MNRYLVHNALEKVISSAKANFTESIDIALVLGIDSKNNQSIRGTSQLPYSIGKTPRIAVFAKDEYASKAMSCKVEVVGAADLINKISQTKKAPFDWCISTPDLMPLVSSSIAKILGPRDLMPNPKTNTVTLEVEEAIKNIKNGQVRFKANKHGVIHVRIGSVKSNIDHLVANINTLLDSIKQCISLTKTTTHIKKLFVNSTMGTAFGVIMEKN